MKKVIISVKSLLAVKYSCRQIQIEHNKLLFGKSFLSTTQVGWITCYILIELKLSN